MVLKRENFTAVATIPDTLTVLLDIDAHIFGGFTPVEWASPRDWTEKAHAGLKSFFFTFEESAKRAGGQICIETR
jgi:hypothetical protein